MNNDKTCVDCEFLETKETGKSKLPYGYCHELKMNMVAIQINCGYYKKQEITKGTA